MKVRAALKKSFQKLEPEDAYVLNDAAQIYGVFDGVTPMDSYRNIEGHNGAYIASNLFKQYFAEQQSFIDPKQGLIEANHRLKKMMLEEQVDMAVKHHLWSTCGAVVSLKDDLLSFAQIGDCMIVAMDKQGAVSLLTEDKVNGVRYRAIAKREQDRLKGIFVPDESFFDDPVQRQAYCRWMANTPEGYGVANGMEEMSNYIQYGTMDISNLSYLLLITDGMIYRKQRCEDVLHQVIELGIETYMSNMEDWERSNKVRPDDKTAILLDFASTLL